VKLIFADAFYFIALVNTRDQAHQRAVQHAQTSDRPLLTTAWILVEVADACAKLRNRTEVGEFIDRLQTLPQIRIVPFSTELFKRGLALYRSRPDKEWSLTDCISFTVMQEEGITEALTGDRHFEQAGFNALLK
jgi:predicted nucleic acid-binding protein